VAYPVKSHNVYNMILMHPRRLGSSEDESWTSKSDKSQMLEIFKDWTNIVHHLLSYVPNGEVIEWSLNTHNPLPRWFENKIVLLGDSCHPMLPYVAQGAAQAIEDAAVLSIVLSRITSRDEVEIALGVYEAVRKERGEMIQQSASTTQKALHLPDGPEQRYRDGQIRAAAAAQRLQRQDAKIGENPDLWADENWQNFMWAADVMSEVYENWESLKRKVTSTAQSDVRASQHKS
jgi:salicylate hydroxylase